MGGGTSRRLSDSACDGTQNSDEDCYPSLYSLWVNLLCTHDVIVFRCKYTHFFEYGRFFFKRGAARGVARGLRVGGARGWVGCGGKRAAAAGRRGRGTAAEGHRGHGRRAEGCAWEECARDHGAPRETAQRPSAPPPPSACGAWVRAPCGGLRVGMFHEEHSCNGLIFSALRLTTTAPAAANVPKIPQQHFAGAVLRGYKCKHVVTNVNTGGYKCTRGPRTAGAGGRRHRWGKGPAAGGRGDAGLGGGGQGDGRGRAQGGGLRVGGMRPPARRPSAHRPPPQRPLRPLPRGLARGLPPTARPRWPHMVTLYSRHQKVGSRSAGGDVERFGRHVIFQYVDDVGHGYVEHTL